MKHCSHTLIPWRYLSKESSHFFFLVGYFIEMFANLPLGIVC